MALMGLLGTGEAKPGQGAAAGGGEDWNVRMELGSVSAGGMGPFRRDLPPLTELWRCNLTLNAEQTSFSVTSLSHLNDDHKLCRNAVYVMS